MKSKSRDTRRADSPELVQPKPRRVDEYSDHDCLSSPQLRRVLGGKSDGEKLSEEGLESLMDQGLIPRPFMLGRFRRWRWGAIDAAIRKLEKQAGLVAIGFVG